MLRGYNLRLEPHGVGAGASGRVAHCETGARGAVDRPGPSQYPWQYLTSLAMRVSNEAVPEKPSRPIVLCKL